MTIHSRPGTAHFDATPSPEGAWARLLDRFGSRLSPWQGFDGYAPTHTPLVAHIDHEVWEADQAYAEAERTDLAQTLFTEFDAIVEQAEHGDHDFWD